MPNLLRAALATALLAAGIAAVTPTAANAAPVTITADYNANAGTFDHAKFLNGNEGGFKTHVSLNWLPESYPEFKQAGMKVVAITHLLNENFYNVVKGTAPNLTYDFAKLDRVIDPLVAQGITPLMGIGFTPRALGGADDPTGFNHAIPNNPTLWAQTMDALVHHYAEVKGASDPRYRGWYWEFWNEPDPGAGTPGAAFWRGTKTDYNNFYGLTAKTVKNVDKTAKVGGPAITQGGFWWFDGADGMSTYLRNHTDVPFDFLSFHSYGPDLTFSLVDEAKSRLVAAGRQGTPIFITEWNITHLYNAAGAASDTNVDASYAARRMADAWRRPELTKIFWFAPKEGWAPTKLFAGNLGMLTVDGHRKAAYNTFFLMNKLQTRMLAAPGNGAVGAFVTRDPSSNGKVAVLAWNDQAADTDLTLRLTNLPFNQRVKVTQYVVDKNHGNHYLDYAEGLRGWKVGPYENADPVDSRIVNGAAELASTLKLRGHGVALFELEPTSEPATNVQQSGPAPIPVGSRNLAQGRPVTASSSVPAEWGWTPGAAVDGLTHSFSRVDEPPVSNGWSSAGNAASASLQVDLGGPVRLSRVKLFPRDDKSCEGYGFPIDFRIEGSTNGTSWTVLRDVVNHNNGQPLAKPVGAQTFNVSGQYRYVRVVASKLQIDCLGAPDRYFQLAELQVESDDNLARTATAAGETTLAEPGWAAANVNDGVESSSGTAKGWSSAPQTTATAAQDLTLTLANPTMLSRVDLVPRDDAGNVGEGFPKTFKVWAASNAGCTDWAQVASRADHPDPGKYARTVGFQARVVKCVKVEATVLDQLPSGSYAFQLAEVRVLH